MKTGKNSKILLLALTIIIAAGIALYGIHTRRTKYYDTTPKFSDNSAKGSVCIPCPYRSMRDIFHIYKLCAYVKVEASSQNVILSARQSTKKATARVC